MSRLWAAWVRLWDGHEHPRALGLCRLLLGVVVSVDLLWMGALGLPPALWGADEAIALGVPLAVEPVPWLWELLPATPASAWLLWGGMLAAGLGVAAGLAPGPAAFAFVLLSAVTARTLPAADRGIDMLVRDAMLVLALSAAGRDLSLGLRLRTGRWTAPPEARAPAWPRRLLFLQLVLVYFFAGVSKVATAWTPFGGWTAMYIALRDPHFAVFPREWVDPLFPLTQALTATTWLWEWAAPVLLLAGWYRLTPERPGRLRAWSNRVDLRAVYLLVGALFHVGTHLTLRLGMFPFAVMALYPVAFHPDELGRAWARLRRRAPPALP